MNIKVKMPGGLQRERHYIVEVVLGEWLGLDYVTITTGDSCWQVTDQQEESSAYLPDCFFQRVHSDWLTRDSLPEQPLLVWDSSKMGLPINLIEKQLPIIYGDPQFPYRECSQPSNQQPATSNQQQVRLPIDIFGSAFFMLTRYEEVIKSDRDEHDRFPAWASLAYQEGFLDRPIIDEYVEVLWAALKSLWPGMERKKRSFQIKVSHDVDRPSRYLFGNTKKFLRSVAADVVKRGNISAALRSPWIRWGGKDQIHPADPANMFDWIMDVSERNGLQSAFYFLSGETGNDYEPDYDIGHSAIGHLMRNIHERGHEIGLHGSYNAYQSPENIVKEADRLRQVCKEKGISQGIRGGRMHYLRWSTPVTFRCWEQAGMSYDSTLGFADCAGFRCGTCHEYTAFDVTAGRQIDLLERPLIAMECTVIDNSYMALGKGPAAFEEFEKLKEACHAFDGNFTLLWHNSRLITSKERELYLSVLDNTA